MSIDLFVARTHPPITCDELRAVLADFARLDGIELVYEQDELAAAIHYWHSWRVSLSLHEDNDPDEEVELLRAPFAVVSSRSGAWPWIEATAVELAKRLRAQIFDPQQGSTYPELVAEHSHAQLRALHDADIAERGAQLVVKYEATLGGDQRAILEATVDHWNAITGCAAHLEPDHVNWSDDSGGVGISSFYWQGSRSLTVSGAAGSERVADIARTLGARLGVTWRRVEIYG